MQPSTSLWAVAFGAAISMHAATFAALSFVARSQPDGPPRVDLPAGEASGVRVFLMSSDRVAPQATVGGDDAPEGQPDAIALDEATQPETFEHVPADDADHESVNSSSPLFAEVAEVTFSPGGDPGVLREPIPDAANRPPEYPEAARRRRQSGTVLLHIAIESDGSVSQVEVSRSSGFDLLDHAALEAAVSWHFSPTLEDGVPQRSQVDLPVVFVLE